MNDTQNSKRGRKPAHESRSDEIKQRIAEWKLVPHGQRKALTELAKELNISHQLASYHASQVPSPDPVGEAKAILAEKLPQILRMCLQEIEKQARKGKLSRDDLRFLRRAAGAGNKKAQALLREQERGSSRG